MVNSIRRRIPYPMACQGAILYSLLVSASVTTHARICIPSLPSPSPSSYRFADINPPLLSNPEKRWKRSSLDNASSGLYSKCKYWHDWRFSSLIGLPSKYYSVVDLFSVKSFGRKGRWLLKCVSDAHLLILLIPQLANLFFAPTPSRPKSDFTLPRSSPLSPTKIVSASVLKCL